MKKTVKRGYIVNTAVTVAVYALCIVLAATLGQGGSFFSLDLVLCLFQKSEHITHAKDTARDTVRVEYFHFGELFTHTDKFYRSARD